MAAEEAIALHRQGRLAEAEILYRREMARDPGQFAPHYQLGVLCMQQGRFGEAAAFLQNATQLQPDNTSALVNLGMSLRQLLRREEALTAFSRATANAPNFAEAHFQKAATLFEMGRAAEAADAVAQARALDPAHLWAIFLEGRVLAALDRPEGARACYDEVLRRDPAHLGALNDRALLAWKRQGGEAALADLDRALALRPDHTQSRRNRGLVLADLGRNAEALAEYDVLLRRDPGDADAWSQRGIVLRALNRDADALESLDRAATLNPNLVGALTNRGNLRWTQQEDYDGAKADLTRALALDPTYPWLEGELFFLMMQGADWSSFPQGRSALAEAVAAGRQAVQPFAYQAISADPNSLQQCARTFAADFPSLAAGRAARASGRIRIGYLSADFREQATAYLMAGVYDAHAERDFEIVGFDNGYDDASPMRARLEKAFSRIIPVAGLPDAEAAKAVEDAGIDILVNLNGYFGRPRMNVFARRAAPLQVNYLGFPATLGAPYMDYIIADRIVIPEQERDFYDEAVVWLPNCYQANDNRRGLPAPARRAEHGLPQDAFVFCNFNQIYKLTPEIFASWLRILRQCDGSLLWLLHDRDIALGRLRQAAVAASVDPQRLVFAPLIPQSAHLSRLTLADLFLDTLPYNAHTTGSDALWAGVPLLTRRGTAFPGRVAASLLTAAQLPELITDTSDAYEALAIKLASDKALLTSYRTRLAETRDTCALFDTVRFTRNLEAAYRVMVETHRQGRHPTAFAVPD